MLNERMHPYSELEAVKNIPLLSDFNEFLKYISKYNECIAISTYEKDFTYEQLLKDVALARTFYQQLNLQAKAHVGLVLKNEYDFIKNYLAITTSGLVAVLIPFQGMAFIDHFVKNNDIEVLVISREFSEKPKLDAQVFYQNEVIADFVSPTIAVNPHDLSTIMFTGGTTGRQKGVMLSHANMMLGTYNGIFGGKRAYGNVYFAIIPFTHSFGLIRSMLTPLLTRSSIYLIDEMKNLFRDLAYSRPTIMILVPALANMIANVALTRGKEAIGGNLSLVIAGGATVTPKIIAKYEKLGIDIYAGYGLTETSLLVSGNTETFKKPKSVGIPYDKQTLKIVNGELLIKGDNVMLGYYNNDEANKQAFDSEGYFKTGDLVEIDDEGFIYIIGRNNNVILFDNGENISPETIEDVLNAHQLVEDSLIYASKNDKGYDILVCEIFPNYLVAEKSNQLENLEVILKQLVNEMNEKLPQSIQISQIIIRKEDFERNPAMKIIRKR